jgi:8-oxo-dGTP diphosphatase
MSPSEVISIAVAVVEHEGRVLIGQRPPGAVLAGYWEFPGGKIRAGERAEEAAQRECLEETGLAIRILATCSEVEHEYEHGRVRIRFLAAAPVESGREPKGPFRWVAISQLTGYEFPPANRDVIRRLVRGVGHPPGSSRAGEPPSGDWDVC